MIIRDGAWTLFDYDFKTGRQVWHMTDSDGREVFRTDYRVDDIMDANQTQRNLSASGWSGDWHHVASVPLNVAFDSGIARAHAEGDHAFVNRFLNSSDNRAWRTKDGWL